MTALARAEQAVAAAREQVWLRPCDQTIDALITAVRALDAEVVRGESLRDDTGTEADRAYNQAINDAANAIEEQQ